MGGKPGGSGGAGAMLEYGNKALDLQKQIYDENKGLIQPYYQAGTSGLNELMMRMGLGGGAAGGYGTKTAAQLRQEMMPAYTSTTRSGMQPTKTYKDNGYLDERYNNGLRVVTRPDGSKTVSIGSGGGFNMDKSGQIINRHINGGSDELNMVKALSLYNMIGGGQSSSVDNAGLDAAVAKAMADQQAASAAAQQNPLYGSLLKSFGMEDYQEDPGYQFRLSEGNKALERALASRGQFSSMNPAAAKALQDFGQQSASQEYGAAYDRYNMNQGNIFNRLAAISGIGQTSTGQLTGQGNQYAQGATDLYTGMGNAVTAAQQAKAANKGSMFNTLLNAGANVAGAYFMSDERLKEDIIPMGQENGHNVYQFRYKGMDKKYIGVLAQEVMETNPEAVKQMDGFYAVNYDAIGVQMREV